MKFQPAKLGSVGVAQVIKHDILNASMTWFFCVEVNKVIDDTKIMHSEDIYKPCFVNKIINKGINLVI